MYDRCDSGLAYIVSNKILPKIYHLCDSDRVIV